MTAPKGLLGLAHVLLAVLGVAVGAAGSLVQDGWSPGGLLLALAGSVALFHGGGLLTRSRLGSALPAALWFLTVVYLSLSRPEGDFLFAAGLGPYLYLLGGTAAGVICATRSYRGPTGRSGARLGR